MTADQNQPRNQSQGNNLLEKLQHLMVWYARFEQIVALILSLSLIITVVIVTALIQLVKNLWPLIVGGALDPLDHKVFQVLFGMTTLSRLKP